MDSRTGAARVALSTLAAFLLGALAVGSVSFRLPGPVEADGYFHLAIARDYAAGRAYDPMIAEGVLAEARADRELLFHLGLAGLLRAGLAPETCLALVPALAAGALGAVLFLATRSWWVVLCGLFASNTFLFRLLMCRPHVVALVLVAAGLALLGSRRYRALGVVNFVYAWSYSVPVLLLGAAGLESVSRFVRHERGWARAVVWTGVTSAAAFVLHPHFPANLEVLWFQGPGIVGRALFGSVLAEGAPDLVPTELRPWEISRFVVDAWLPLALFAVTVGLSVRRRSRESGGLQGTPAWLVVFLGLLLLATLRSLRFIEYFAPLACLGAGGAIAWLVGPIGRPARAAILVLLVAARPALGWWATDTKAREVAPSVTELRPAAEWLRDHAAGESVLNLRWDTYAVLRWYGGTFRIAEGCDPSFLHDSDPERWRLLRAVERGHVAPEALADLGYEWILAPAHSHLGDASSHPELEIAWEDEHVTVLRVRR